MKKISKGKAFFKNIRLFSTAILLLGAVSFSSHSQNYPAPGQPTSPIPNSPTPTPNPTNPNQQYPNQPTTPNTPGTMPTIPNTNQPSQLHQDTMHLYNPVKPDTGHLKSQLNRTTSFKTYELNPLYSEENNNISCGELCIRKIS